MDREDWQATVYGVAKSWTQFPDVQATFKKGRGTRLNFQHPLDHQKSKRIPEKTSISALLITPKPLCESQQTGKFLKRWEYQTTLPASWTSLVAQMVKRLPTMQETQVQSLGREDLLEKEMVTHSSILAWKIPWTRSLEGYNIWCHKELDATEWILFLYLLPEKSVCRSKSNR